MFKYLTTHFTHNINYGFHTLPPKWLVLVQQMLDVIIFSETCGATVEPAVHQKRTHYRASQITVIHFHQQVLHIHDKNGHHPMKHT